MKDHEKARDEKKEAEAVREKRPYQTPRLKKLGSVEQLTEGVSGPIPDDTFFSI